MPQISQMIRSECSCTPYQGGGDQAFSLINLTDGIARAELFERLIQSD